MAADCKSLAFITSINLSSLNQNYQRTRIDKKKKKQKSWIAALLLLYEWDKIPGFRFWEWQGCCYPNCLLLYVKSYGSCVALITQDTTIFTSAWLCYCWVCLHLTLIIGESESDVVGVWISNSINGCVGNGRVPSLGQKWANERLIDSLTNGRSRCNNLTDAALSSLESS